MDQPQYSSLLGLLANVPDPRKARGKQLEWTFIWGIIVSAARCLANTAPRPLLPNGRGVMPPRWWRPAARRVDVCRVSRRSAGRCSAWTSLPWNTTSHP